MGEYFKPWRRKIGILTLLLACVFAAGWVRSSGYEDEFQISIGDADHVFESRSSKIRWHGIGPLGRESELRIQWHATPLSPPPPLKLLVRQGSGMARAKYFDVVAVPYWSIVIPLALLSAWLLLSKPRS
jgi:hypothetical protein